jgi:hypothetical protein
MTTKKAPAKALIAEEAKAPAAPVAEPVTPQPTASAARIAELEKEVGMIRDVMRRNGWTLPN